MFKMTELKVFVLFVQVICLFLVINATGVYGQNKQQFQRVANSPGQIDYDNIKHQISAKLFSNYDPQHLKLITDALGCKTQDCPQLLSASNIEYNVLETVGKRFIGRGDVQKKLIIQSTDTEVANASPVQQNVSTIAYTLDCIQNLEITVTKTTQIKSERKIGIGFISYTKTEIETKTEVTRTGETHEHIVNFPSQNITVEPFSKMNVTFNFYHQEYINNYLLDFQIADNSTFSHLDVANNAVVFVKKPLGDFLQSNIKFISTLKYDDDMMLKLIEKDGKFIVKNFPASEKMTSYGADVIFGKATKLSE